MRGVKADLDGYAGARTGFHNEAGADGFAQGQGLNLTPADHGGGSILGTPVHRVGPQIFDTPVYDGKPEPFVTPLPETGPGSLVTPIPGDRPTPLPGFTPADDGLRSGSVLLRGENDHKYFPAPKTLPAFPDAIKTRVKTYNKANKLRQRWKTKELIIEWDSQHGKVEVYNKTGKRHLGEFDPYTGKQTKPANPKRTVEK